MSDQEKTQYLANYYYNIRNPAAYTTPKKLYQALKANKDFHFSKYFISKWLKNRTLIHYSDRLVVPLKFLIFVLVVSMFNGVWTSWTFKTYKKKMMASDFY